MRDGGAGGLGVAGPASDGRLPSSLGLWQLVVFGLAFMVPIAPFGVFGSIFSVAHGQVAAVYIVAAVVMALTAASFVNLSRQFSGVGSVHTYVSQAVGPAVGFLAGWMLLLDYLLVPGLICLLTANGLHAAVPAVPVPAWILVVGASVTALNLLGLQKAIRAGAAVLAGQLVVLTVVIVAMARHVALDPPTATAAPLLGSSSTSWGTLFAGSSVAVLSYLGFESVATLGEENRGHPSSIGKAIAVSLASCAALFVVQSWLAALLVQDPSGLLTEGDLDGSAFYAAVTVAGGQQLASLAAVTLAVSGAANSLVAQAATARLLVSFARAGQAPAVLGRVRRAPVAAGLVVAVLTLTVALLAAGEGRLAVLVTLINVGALTAFAGVHCAAFVHFVLRKGSRRLLHVVVPPAGLLLVLVVLLSSADVARGLGAVWLAAGVVVLIVGVRRGRRPAAEQSAPAGR